MKTERNLKCYWILTVLMVIFSLCGLKPVHAQFSVDVAYIVAQLQALNIAMQKYLGMPLAAMQKTQQSQQKYMQEILYPTTEISKLHLQAQQLYTLLTQLQTSLNTRRIYGSIPSTQSFEHIILSGNPSILNSLPTDYHNVYGTVPQGSQVPAALTTSVDALDAEAISAFTRAVQLDALAATEQQQSKNLLSQIQSAAPGNVSLLIAQENSLLIQGQAYIQQGQAELLRIRATAVADKAAQRKQNYSIMAGSK